MATVSNIKLKIGPGSSSSRRLVTVTYKICFSACEAMDKTVFVERVTLWGDDPIWDDKLVTLRAQCIRAQRGCIDREVSTDISRSTLDEDPDTIIFGWVIGAKDEIYARVGVKPFKPSSASGNSNIVTGQFGPAGA